MSKIKFVAFLAAFLFIFQAVPSVPCMAQTIENADKAPNCQAKSYVLIEALTGEIIAGKNVDAPFPMASTTKIMTALLTLEQKELDKEFIVDSEAIKTVGTSMGLRTGDSVTLYKLAVGMLLPSGNDAANAAACKISGSIEKFSDLMNEKAQEIGMTNTHFVTPSGLDDDNHFSSAYDMAILAKYALKNELFASICKSEKIKIKFGASGTPLEYRTFYNHNRLLKEYDGCVGVKTGFTDAAGRCLVSAATRNGVTLICVTLHASDDFSSHKRLFDYGFETVKLQDYKVETQDITRNVVGGTENKVTIKPFDTKYYAVSSAKNFAGNFKEEILITNFLYAPINKGDICGMINHKLNGETIAVTPLVAEKNIDAITEREHKYGIIEKILQKLKNKNK